MDPIITLISCHNRREKTIACLRALLSTMLSAHQDFHVYLCDDGCTDGTVDAAKEIIGDRITIAQGDGSLFWNRGMIAAWGIAPTESNILLLNDDVILDESAIPTLLSAHKLSPHAILVGSLRDPIDGRLTYGGRRQGPWWNRLRTTLVEPGHLPNSCDTFNGNVVLIPASSIAQLGTLDPAFIHAMGDLDYGFRARRLSIPILVVPGFIGRCPANPIKPRPLTIKGRWQAVCHPKSTPIGAWFTLCRRHAGVLWPIIFMRPYIRTIAKI
jgi:GT2 family glycosyltransferase